MKGCALILLTLLAAGKSETVAAQPEPASKLPKEIPISEIISDGDRLSYRGYSIRKRHRKVRIDDAWESKKPYFADEEYLVLSRHRRILIRFDGTYSPIGNSVQFGLFSFLGRGRKQLFVSQDLFRGGNQWIVTLGKSARVIYDGSAWRTGREGDDMSLVDLDRDGILEVITPTCIFYGFANLSPAATPLPTIVFKYSKRSKRYLPANPHFANYLLTEVEDKKKNIQSIGDPVNNMNHLGDVLDIVLQHVFTGREAVGWKFFDQAYKLPDKNMIKRAIRAELKDSPVYRFIYRKRTRRRT